MPAFVGLNQEMFGVYVPQKWSSNVHNLPRMRNKDAMMALGAEIDAALGQELAGLMRQGSDEIPNVTNHRRVETQWVFWARDAEARSALSSFLERTKLTENALFTMAAQDKHAIVGVQMRHDGIWVGLRIAPGASVDGKNLAAKLRQSWEREHLRTLLGRLPAHAELTLGEKRWPVAAIEDADVTEIVRRLEAGGEEFQVGALTLAAEGASLGRDLPGVLIPILRELLPLYRFSAWSRDNDLIEATRKLQQEKADKRRASVAFDQGQKVRFIAGLMQGKQGVVQGIEAKSKVRVMVGTLSVVVSGSDLVNAV